VQPLLEVKQLRTSFFTEEGELRAVDGVSFAIEPGKLMGLVGESGSGKTVSALSIMRLLPESARVVDGSILFEGHDLRTLSEPQMREIRGAKIAMIFQEPMTSLNPVFTIGSQIGEAIRLHQGKSRKEARERTIEMLHLVKIADPERRVDDYPHQLSGGMRQRVMIAMALACSPELLIADEPTTALDVTIQAQILDLLAEMKAKFGMAIMLITHAMGVVAEVAQRVAVMYAGRVVEEAPVEELFAHPLHPYTQGLIRSIPRLEKGAKGVAGRKRRLDAISGTVPSLITPPPGCRFAPRCTFASAECAAAVPELRTIEGEHKVACILYKPTGAL